MEESSKYFVRRRGRTEGPWPMSKLRSEVALRKLGRFDDVSSDGENWKRASDVEGLFVSENRRPGGAGSPSASTAPSSSVTSAEDDLRLTPHLAVAAMTTKPQAAPADDLQWFWCIDDRPHLGPFDTEALRQAIQRGECPRQALVWREGFADWQTPAAVAQFRDLFSGGASERTDFREAGAGAPAPLGNSLAAIFAVVIGIGSLALSAVPLVGGFGLAALGLGVYAIREIRSSEGELTGFGLAIAGIVTGSLAALVGAVWLVLLVLAFAASDL